MTQSESPEEEQALLDRLMDEAMQAYPDRERDYRDFIRSEWERAVNDTEDDDQPGRVVLAFDGDEAGTHAAEEAFLNVLRAPVTQKNFIRSFVLRGESYDRAIRWLSNEELFQEFSENSADEKRWRDRTDVDGAFKREWITALRDHKQACMMLINERSDEASAYSQRGFKNPAGLFNAAHSITEVLAMFDIQAVPGKNIQCPAHDDSSPSCTVFAHDQRIYCHAAHCVLNGGGKGEDAYGLYRVLSETTK